MQPALMRRALFIFCLVVTPLPCVSLELDEQAHAPVKVPPKSTINNELVTPYHVSDTKAIIRVCRNTLFCIAQEAMAAKRTYPNGISEPVIIDDYYLHNYDKNSLELLANNTRITETRHDGWHFYIFRTKQNKGSYFIHFLPKANGLPEKKFDVLIV